ncbi:hypothetical protein ACFSVJ_21140 [Prauserella oleivorans]
MAVPLVGPPHSCGQLVARDLDDAPRRQVEENGIRSRQLGQGGHAHPSLDLATEVR